MSTSIIQPTVYYIYWFSITVVTKTTAIIFSAI